MKEIICQAISDRRLLRFDYHGYERLVEPHACGELATGNLALRCYQIDGGSDSGNPVGWKLMLLDEITGIEILDEGFDSPRAGYRKGDKAMKRIYCEV